MAFLIRQTVILWLPACFYILRDPALMGDCFFLCPKGLTLAPLKGFPGSAAAPGRLLLAFGPEGLTRENPFGVFSLCGIRRMKMNGQSPGGEQAPLPFFRGLLPLTRRATLENPFWGFLALRHSPHENEWAVSRR